MWSWRLQTSDVRGKDDAAAGRSGARRCGFFLFASLLTREAALKARKSSFGSGRERGKHDNRFGTIGALLLLSTMLCGAARSDEPVYDIDIPSTTAAQALNRFAEQTGAIMLFSYDLASARRTNAVRGRYTLLEGLDLLLRGTGLSGGLSDKRVVNISQTRDSQRIGEEAVVQKEPASWANRVAAFVGSMFAVSAASGQDVSSPAQSIEEVIVTAQKREERLQDVPISITAITADEIDRRGLLNAEDYLRGVPGANQVDSANGPSIVIRGIESSPQNQNFASGATTATYFGETPTTNSAGLSSGTNIDLKLVDIERVEVLRGPQGTAFGSSSLGGAVRTIPVAPKLDQFEGKLVAGYSATSGTGGGNTNARAALNLPLFNDRFAVRAVGYSFEDSGFYNNRAGSDAAFRAAVVTPFGAEAFAIDAKEVGSYSTLGGRVAALLQASDQLKFTLSYLTQEAETDGLSLATSGTYDQTILRVAAEHAVRGERGGVADSEIDIANAVMEYEFGWANLVATYSHTKSGSTVSQTDQLYAGTWPASSLGVGDHREDVGEIRLATQFDGAWNFLAGVYAEKLDDEYRFDYRWFGDPATNFLCGPACVGQSFVGHQEHQWDLKQKTAFGEVSWKFLEQWTLTGGMRAYDYERSIAVESSGPIFTGAVGAPPVSTSTPADASGSTYKLNLSYKPADEALIYAGWSQGFRLGKPQPQLPAGSCDPDGDGIIDGTNIPLASSGNVTSDNVDSYELGGKFSFLDRRLKIEAAVFRMEWSDIPVRAAAGRRPTSCGLTYVVNAGEALSEGVEMQASFQVTDPFRIDIGGSYIDARLTEDVPREGFSAGDRLPGSPRANANLGLQYEFVIGGRNTFLRADSIYVGSFYGDVLQTPNLQAGDYVKLDASARMEFGALSVDLFARNLTNEDAFTFRGVSRAVGEFHGYRLRPRTVGLQLGYSF